MSLCVLAWSSVETRNSLNSYIGRGVRWGKKGTCTVLPPGRAGCRLEGVGPFMKLELQRDDQSKMCALHGTWGE